MKKNKKGFTLIELIVVISILIVLGSIIVPKIAFFTAKADKAKVQGDAKIVLQAINAYNVEGTHTEITAIDKTSMDKITIDSGTEVPSYFIKDTNVLSVLDLNTIASGNLLKFSVKKTSGTYSVDMVEEKIP